MIPGEIIPLCDGLPHKKTQLCIKVMETTLKRFSVWILGFALSAFVSACGSSPQAVFERLRTIDKSMQEQPAQSLDSLMAMDPSSLNKGQSAYYNLLLTIAQHKNRIPFPGDSAISSARAYFMNHTQEYYNQARASFYHGVVRQMSSTGDTLAHKLILEARQIMAQHDIRDDKLSALVNAYLGKINYADGNLEDADRYLSVAVESERKLGNSLNMILDLCKLLICQVTLRDSLRAERTLSILDSALTCNPDSRNENINNAKTIFYLYIPHQLDSASFYCQKWKPAPGDYGAKQQLLATIYRKQGNFSAAIDCEIKAFENRRSADSLYYHSYYNQLASLYDQLGNRDSSAHYARMAYQSLSDSYTQKTGKRVLELEKQYDLAAKEFELSKVRHQRTLLTVLLLSALILIAFLVWNLRLSRQLKESDQQAKLKDSLARSLLMSTLSSYSGINRRLGYIHNLPDNKRQEALDQFIRENQKTLAGNIDGTLASFAENIPPKVRAIADTLGGVQQRAVFILIEMGFSIGDIANMLSTTSAQVRSVKSTVRKQLERLSAEQGQDISHLEIMQK